MTLLSDFFPAGGASKAPWDNDNFPDIDDYVVDNYYESTASFEGSATAITLTDISFAPFVPFADHTFTGIAFSCYGTQSTTIQMGIYDSDAAGNPNSLLTADNLSVTLGGAPAFNEITISEALTKDTLYWLAIIASAQTSFLNMLKTIKHHSYRLGMSPEKAALINSTQSISPMTFPKMTHTPGNPLPATAVIDTATALMPRIWLRA